MIVFFSVSGIILFFSSLLSLIALISVFWVFISGSLFDTFILLSNLGWITGRFWVITGLLEEGITFVLFVFWYLLSGLLLMYLYDIIGWFIFLLVTILFVWTFTFLVFDVGNILELFVLLV